MRGVVRGRYLGSQRWACVRKSSMLRAGRCTSLSVGQKVGVTLFFRSSQVCAQLSSNLDGRFPGAAISHAA